MAAIFIHFIHEGINYPRISLMDNLLKDTGSGVTV